MILEVIIGVLVVDSIKVAVYFIYRWHCSKKWKAALEKFTAGLDSASEAVPNKRCGKLH